MSEEKSKVDRLDDTLYSRTRYQNPLNTRSGVRNVEAEEGVAENWQSPGLDEILTRERKSVDRTSFMKKFFIFASLFFAATMIVAGFVFLGGNNFISSKNLDIVVVGPSAVPAGEEAELQVTIKNGNNADLQTANFSVQYPQGARSATDNSQALTFTKEDLGVIGAGDEVVRNVRFMLIGVTGETKELKFSVEYKVKGSNATFYKDKVYTMSVGSSPLSITVDTPDSIASGDTFKTVVSVSLNSTEVLKNVMLRGEYPYGYSVTSSSPSAFADNNVWALGDIAPGSTKEIEINGRLMGENQEERTFRYYAGVAEGETPTANFKTVVFSIQKTIAVDRPSIGLFVNLNGDSDDTYVAPAGQVVEGSVTYRNNLPEKLLNPQLHVRLSGAALDESSISTYSNGFYNSNADRIEWDLTNNMGSNELAPGNEGTVLFRLASLRELTAVQGNKGITLEIVLTGTPLGSNAPVTVSETRTIKIASQVTLSSKMLYSTGPFANKGSLPPKAEKETTYTATLSVGNTQNTLTESKVTARLGPGVKWVGNTTSKEKISYDEPSNTVTWNLETLESGAGFSQPLREASFQVSFTPSLSQVGTVPVLVNNISFSGFETLAQKTITLTNSPLTTRLTSDPVFVQGDDVVTR